MPAKAGLTIYIKLNFGRNMMEGTSTDDVKKVLYIFRVLNTLRHVSGRQHRKEQIEKFVRILEKTLKNNPNERALFFKMAKSMALLTAGNVPTVHGFAEFDPSVVEPWYEYFNAQFSNVLSMIVPEYDSNSTPTEEDYKNANELLVLMSGTSLGDYQNPQVELPDAISDMRGGENMRGKKLLYRGVSGMSTDVIKFLMKSPKWNLGGRKQEDDTEKARGVSTSYNKKKARQFSAWPEVSSGEQLFASMNGPSVFFEIDNSAARVGFHADTLSLFTMEKEVILSGILEVNDWELRMEGIFRDNSTAMDVKVKAIKSDLTVTFHSQGVFHDTKSFETEEEFLNFVNKILTVKAPAEYLNIRNSRSLYAWQPREHTILLIIQAETVRN